MYCGHSVNLYVRVLQNPLEGGHHNDGLHVVVEQPAVILPMAANGYHGLTTISSWL